MPFVAAEIGDIGEWTPGPAGVRDVILAYRITVADFRRLVALPPEAESVMPTERELEAVVMCAHDAVSKGRMIHFGHWSNAAIQLGGKRAGPLWNKQALALPFADPWVFMHTWDPAGASDQHIATQLGFDPRPPCSAAVYLVVPEGARGLWLCELLPIKYDGITMLELGDRCLLHVNAGLDDAHRYECTAAPTAARYVIAEKVAGTNPAADAAANVLDPAMLALLMLNTRNVERRTVAFDKPNRGRVKCGKPPLPPYDEVQSGPYITALTLGGRSRPHGEEQGSTHRSPTPHIRMGHTRTYASGIVSLIRDTLVNVPPEQRDRWKQSRRSHYQMRS